MNKKRIYIVRHAESELNARRIHQQDEGALSEKGREQASVVAERFVDIPVQRIISSPYPRARETADEIARTTGCAIEELELLRERRHPSDLVGKSLDDPEGIKIRKIIHEQYHHHDWKYADEENFSDVKTRALEVVRYIEGLSDERVALVTHAGFTRFIVASMMYGDELDSHFFLKFLTFTKLSNTGITICEWTESDGWKLVTWNDHAHIS